MPPASPAGTIRRLPAVLLLLASCAGSEYLLSPPLSKPPPVVLAAALQVLEAQRFNLTHTEPGLVEAVQFRLSPAAYQGLRWTATVRIEETEDGTVVRVGVDREINGNIVTPLSERDADWGKGEFDEETAEVLRYMIREKVQPTVVPPETLREGGRR